MEEPKPTTWGRPASVQKLSIRNWDVVDSVELGTKSNFAAKVEIIPVLLLCGRTEREYFAPARRMRREEKSRAKVDGC